MVLQKVPEATVAIAALSSRLRFRPRYGPAPRSAKELHSPPCSSEAATKTRILATSPPVKVRRFPTCDGGLAPPIAGVQTFVGPLILARQMNL